MGPYSSAALNKSINSVEWSVRVQNCLAHYHEYAGTGQPLEYIGDLVQVKSEDLLVIPNFGRVSLREVKEVLASDGLTLGMDIGRPGLHEQMQYIFDGLSDLFERFKHLQEYLNDSPRC